MIPKDRVLDKLDSFLKNNDYQGAKRLLDYWLNEAKYSGDAHGLLLIENELMGLHRKLGEKGQALKFAQDALNQVTIMGIEHNVGAATTYLNSATVFKAFDMAEEALPLYEKAKSIYELNLSPDDERLGGLYNNMGLALVDLKRFKEADELYNKALSVMESNNAKEPEQAITYLNMATAVETEFGLTEGKIKIDELIKKAMVCMDLGKSRTDGNYAFVCEKCVSVFGYYGYTDYAKELNERARRIYEGA